MDFFSCLASNTAGAVTRATMTRSKWPERSPFKSAFSACSYASWYCLTISCRCAFYRSVRMLMRVFSSVPKWEQRYSVGQGFSLSVSNSRIRGPKQAQTGKHLDFWFPDSCWVRTGVFARLLLGLFLKRKFTWVIWGLEKWKLANPSSFPCIRRGTQRTVLRQSNIHLR